jgi:cellulose synthase/poly-beta-1,6-N-acetylglucosamine synthase-like glycosyltransferase
MVDDRSNDGTYDLLLRETKQDPRLRVVKVDHLPEHVNGKKYGITLAIKAATHDWVLLTDADCRPASTRWIKSIAERFDEKAEIILGYSPYTKEKGMLNLFIRFETLFTAIQYFGFAQLGLPYMGVGRNLAYRKSLFLENKGFNGFLRVTGGDDDLFINEHATRSNTRVCMGEETLVYSKPKQTWKAFFNQKVRHLAVGRRYRLKDRLILGIFMASLEVTWFGGFTLLALQSYPFVATGLLALRSGVLLLTVHQASKKLGHRFEVWAVPFLDFLFAFYYISTGPVALVAKNVKWKT